MYTYMCMYIYIYPYTMHPINCWLAIFHEYPTIYPFMIPIHCCSSPSTISIHPQSSLVARSSALALSPGKKRLPKFLEPWRAERHGAVRTKIPRAPYRSYLAQFPQQKPYHKLKYISRKTPFFWTFAYMEMYILIWMSMPFCREMSSTCASSCIMNPKNQAFTIRLFHH